MSFAKDTSSLLFGLWAMPSGAQDLRPWLCAWGSLLVVQGDQPNVVPRIRLGHMGKTSAVPSVRYSLSSPDKSSLALPFIKYPVKNRKRLRDFL